MKLTLTVMLVTVAFCVSACTTTYDLTPSPRESHPWMETQYRTYHDFLSEAEGKTVRIVLTSGREILGTITRADTDSVGWTGGTEVTTEDPGGWMKPAQANGSTRTDSAFFTAGLVPASRVQSLAITHHYHLWWLGSLVGLIGATAAVAGAWEPEGTNHGLDYSGRTGVVAFGLGGALVGGLATGFIYHRDQYLTGTNGRADTTKSR